MNSNKYSDRLKQVLQLSKEAAVQYKTSYIGTEHVLLAILIANECTACKLLKKVGVDYKSYLDPFRRMLTHDPVAVPDFTWNTKKLFSLAEEYAISEDLNHWEVGTEHVLLAILTNQDCYAYSLLQSLGADMQTLTKLCEDMLSFEGLDDIEESIGHNEPSKLREMLARESEPSTLPSVLESVGEDLTQKAREGRLDPVIGRRKEIEKVVQILSRRSKNNPVLVGEPGVGKSAVIEGLARAIVEGEVPDLLRNKTVFSLNVSSLVAGTRFRGDFEEKLKNVIAEIKQNKNIILFIDEIHMIVGAGGSADNPVDAANILKPMLARGEFQTVGATTIEEYRKFIEKDAALERRFTPVTVEQPNEEDAIAILTGLRDKYEVHHNVAITDEAIEAAVRLSDRYITDRFLPDKAIDLIDEAASHARLTSFNGPSELHEAEENLVRCETAIKKAAKLNETERVQALTAEHAKLAEKIARMREEWKRKRNYEQVSIGAEDVAAIVSGWTGVPVSKLNEQESERLLRLEEQIHKRIVGQDEAVSAVCKAIRRARAGLKDPNRPVGSFIFVGPTGVGKTDLAKALAENLFGDERLMVRLDMSEYMDKTAVNKFIGAPPGYVGFEDTENTLTEKIRRKPYSVVLFDEIEKAHPDVFNVLLQLLDDGRLTDSRGRVVSFKNTVIILTSNVGAHTSSDSARLGFFAEDDASKYEDMKEQINEALKKQFRPEFLNRLDDVIIFRNLTRAEAAGICDKILASLVKRLEEKSIGLSITNRARQKLVEEGYSEEFGARPLKRVIQKKVEDRLSEELLRGKISQGDTVLIDVLDGALVFQPLAK